MIEFRLWSINRWLRYTGLRLFVAVDPKGWTRVGGGSRVGILWAGLPGSKGWKRFQGLSGAPKQDPAEEAGS